MSRVGYRSLTLASIGQRGLCDFTGSALSGGVDRPMSLLDFTQPSDFSVDRRRECKDFFLCFILLYFFFFFLHENHFTQHSVVMNMKWKVDGRLSIVEGGGRSMVLVLLSLQMFFYSCISLYILYYFRIFTIIYYLFYFPNQQPKTIRPQTLKTANRTDIPAYQSTRTEQQTSNKHIPRNHVCIKYKKRSTGRQSTVGSE